MVLGGSPAEWLTLLALVVGPGLVATVLWLPVLASSRLRTLFRALPPSGSTVASYVLVGLGLSVPWLVGLGWALAAIGSRADPEVAGGEPLLGVAGQLGLLYVIELPVVAGAGLPRLDVDWDPNGYPASTFAVLGFAAAWYAAIFSVPTFLVAVIVSLPA